MPAIPAELHVREPDPFELFADRILLGPATNWSTKAIYEGRTSEFLSPAHDRIQAMDTTPCDRGRFRGPLSRPPWRDARQVPSELATIPGRTVV